MKPRMKIKMGIDFLIQWYDNLFKGKYKLLRIVQTIVNFSVLISMLCLGYSGKLPGVSVWGLRLAAM